MIDGAVAGITDPAEVFSVSLRLSACLSWTHPALLTPFQAASVALRMAGTDRDTGYVTVLDPLDTPETFEFLRVDGTLAIV
jgi:hypothetical protein